MKDLQNEHEQFSNDHLENLRIENELLKLKLQVESNAIINTDEISPELENVFLRYVQQFEMGPQDSKQIKIYDQIGKPAFKFEAELNDTEIIAALNALLKLLDKYYILVEFLGDYDNRTKYRFITEEVFDHETAGIQTPELLLHMVYEDFHPDHKMDIEALTKVFINHWLTRNFKAKSELDEVFCLPDGSLLTKEEVLKKLNNVFESFISFPEAEFQINEVSFQWQDVQPMGLGQAEGFIKYTALLENRETVSFEGPFKLYLSHDGIYWTIYYFIFPGFEW